MYSFEFASLAPRFVGSEGTLGIITAAVLKLAPLPRAKAAFVAVSDVEAAVQLLCEANGGPDRP